MPSTAHRGSSARRLPGVPIDPGCFLGLSPSTNDLDRYPCLLPDLACENQVARANAAIGYLSGGWVSVVARECRDYSPGALEDPFV
jgi:hypothetical protein